MILLNMVILTELMCSFALSTIFVAVTISIVLVGVIELVKRAFKKDRKTLGRALFFAIAWVFVSILEFIEHRALHYENSRFAYLLVSHISFSLMIAVVLVWLFAFSYFKKKFNVVYYTLGGIFAIFSAGLELFNDFMKIELYETLEGGVIILPVVFGYFMIIDYLIRNIKWKKE